MSPCIACGVDLEASDKLRPCPGCGGVGHAACLGSSACDACALEGRRALVGEDRKRVLIEGIIGTLVFLVLLANALQQALSGEVQAKGGVIRQGDGPGFNLFFALSLFATVGAAPLLVPLIEGLRGRRFRRPWERE